MPTAVAPASGRAARDRFTRAGLVGGALSCAVYLFLQVDLLDQRVFGNFYDIQARALLDGDLAVPAGSLGREAFLARGDEFLYNPPGPSLLRLPIFVVTDRFDGRLTALSMLTAYVLTVVLVALLLWRVRNLLRPGADLPVAEAVAHGAFVFAATVGSTALYLGAVPWIFHEAYSWSIAMALGVAYALIGVLTRPTRAGVLALAAFTTGAVLSRATAGFACAIAVLAGAAWLLRGRSAGTARSWWWPVALAGALPVVVGAALNWAKFRHPWLFPIEDQVFTDLSRTRREAIEANGGDLFGLDLAWSTVPAYLRPDGVAVGRIFPFVSLPLDPAPAYRGATFDLTYRTGSIVAFMPLLVVLAVGGVVTSFRRGADRARVVLRLPLIGLALVPAGVIFGAYIAHRYTAEFVPFLLVGAAVGAVEVTRRASSWSVTPRRAAAVALGVLAAWGVLANLAVAVSTRAMANPGAVLAAHLDAQERWSPWLGGDLDDIVVASVELPAGSTAGEVRIIGDCRAVYVGTGETYTPWVDAGIRPLHFSVTRGTTVPSDGEGRLELARVTGHRSSALVIEREGPRYRVALVGGGYDDAGPWVEPAPGAALDVVVATDRADDYVITVAGSTTAELRLPKEVHDEDWLWRPNLLEPVAQTPQTLAGQGLLLETRETGAPPGCPERLRRYRASVDDP